VPERANGGDEELGGESGRPMWSGTVSFGLVNVPVALMPANRPKRVSFRMVSPDGVPLRRRYFSSKTERELKANEIVRGYELEKKKYVPLTDDELERLAPDRSRNIDVQLFVKADELDPMHFERAYFLTPTGGSNNAYRLLARAMEETGRAGIAKFVMRSKEYLTAILAENGILRLETLRLPSELRSPEDVGLPKATRAAPADVKRIAAAVRKLEEKSISRKELEDPMAARMLALAKKKARKGEDVVEVPEEAEDGTQVIDFVAVLQDRLRQSLEATGARKKKSSKRPSKRATAGTRRRKAG
jgi:DNA end-binding protein Ku